MGIFAKTIAWLRRRRRTDNGAPDEIGGPDGGPVWCVAANVVLERDYGGGRERRQGTKHFAPGAKVFVYLFFWGMGGETVKVIGRHRKSRRYIRLAMPANHLANWRAELAYSPYVIKQVRREGEFSRFRPGSTEAKLRAVEIAAVYMKQGGRTQPFVTRPPSDPRAGLP